MIRHRNYNLDTVTQTSPDAPQRISRCVTFFATPCIVASKAELLAGLLTALVMFSGMSQAENSDSRSSLSRLQQCFKEIDQANVAFENGRADQARKRLDLLTQSCKQVPHLYHNLGAIALLERRWNDAIGYFEKSLALDARAAMTQKSLVSVYQYKAAMAYKKALNLDGPDPRMPSVTMQTSRILNSPAAQIESNSPTQAQQKKTITNDLHSMDAVEFEVNAWWQAQRNQDLDSYFSFYATGVFPLKFDSQEQWKDHWTQLNTKSVVTLPKWTEVRFSVESLPPYALVTLHHEDQTPLLLILEKQQQIWKITKERMW